MMVEIEHATLRYKNGTIGLNDVSFSVNKGDFIFLVGTTGSGKTSLFRIIHREEVPQMGRVYVLGQDVRHMPRHRVPHLRRNMGIVFQDYRLLPHRTVYENVLFALEVMGAPVDSLEERTMESMSLVGLESKADSFPDKLSGGELQRTCIARAMVNKPPLLLADEPTGNLDPDTSLDIIKVLEKINLRGTTVIVSTHDKAIVDHMAKTVIRMEEGRIIARDEKGTYQGNENGSQS